MKNGDNRRKTNDLYRLPGFNPQPPCLQPNPNRPSRIRLKFALVFAHMRFPKTMARRFSAGNAVGKNDRVPPGTAELVAPFLRPNGILGAGCACKIKNVMTAVFIWVFHPPQNLCERKAPDRRRTPSTKRLQLSNLKSKSIRPQPPLTAPPYCPAVWAATPHLTRTR